MLSYAEAKAARILGARLASTDPAAAEELILRAVALQPRNLDPVVWLAAQAHSLRGDSPAAREAIANTYVLTRTVQALGQPRDIQWVLEELYAAGFDADHLAELEEQVREKLRRIREIQVEVFGESVIDEVLL